MEREVGASRLERARSRSRSMRLRVGAVAFALASLGLASVAPPVAACVGARMGDAMTDPNVAAIFSGTAVAVADPRLPFDMGIWSFDLMRWTFVVDDVEKGPAALVRATVQSERLGMSCGYEFELGNRYRVVATEGREGLYASSFGGTEQIKSLPNPPPVETPAPGPGLNPYVLAAFAAVAIFAALVFGRHWDSPSHPRSPTGSR